MAINLHSVCGFCRPETAVTTTTPQPVNSAVSRSLKEEITAVVRPTIRFRECHVSSFFFFLLAVFTLPVLLGHLAVIIFLLLSLQSCITVVQFTSLIDWLIDRLISVLHLNSLQPDAVEAWERSHSTRRHLLANKRTASKYPMVTHPRVRGRDYLFIWCTFVLCPHFIYAVASHVYTQVTNILYKCTVWTH